MIVELAVAADYANMAEHGKLNVSGIFDRIFADQFPMSHPFMVLAFRLRFDSEDANQSHTTELNLVAQDGTRLGGGIGEVHVGAVAEGQREIFSQVVPFAGLSFPEAGEYRFVLRWDGVEKASIPLSLLPLPTDSESA